jgi:hypothetical protein
MEGRDGVMLSGGSRSAVLRLWLVWKKNKPFLGL